MKAGIPWRDFLKAVVCQPLVAAAAMVAVVCPDGIAAEHWIRLTTPHFEIYTTNSEKQGTAALQVFEQVRYFFVQSSHLKTAPDTAVRIIAFRSEKEFKPYRVNEGAFAYYVRSRKVDYIVVQDISPEHYRAAVHEYTHLIVEHLGLTFPLWLNEGLADFYSTVEPKGNRSVVGRPIEGHALLLRSQSWIDLNTLFAVDRESPYYNERDKMSTFYAESWALTHMVELGKNYMSGTVRFLALMASGRPTADCFQSVYGKSLAEVTKDLHAYVNQSSVQGALFDVKLSKPDLEPDVSEPSEFNVDLALSDLLASRKETSAEAAERLSRLAQEHPESAEVQESLGYVAWEQGNLSRAKESFKLAIDRGSKNPEMLFHYSELLHQSRAPVEEMIAVLQRAITIKPDYQDAWFNLGMAQMEARHWSAALNAFSHIKTITTEHAYQLFSAQAYCYLRLDARQQARTATEKANQYAKGRDEESQVSNMLRELDSLDQERNVAPESKASPTTAPVAQTEAPDRPRLTRDHEIPRDVPSVRWPGNLQHVEAVAKFFECNAKTPRLHVIVNSREMVFALDDPKGVIVRNGNNGGSFNINCGPQKPFKVGIFYVPSDPSTRVDGLLRELVF